MYSGTAFAFAINQFGDDKFVSGANECREICTNHKILTLIETDIIEEMTADKKINLILYTIMHFIVDLSCIFYIVGMVFVRLPDQQQWVEAAVLYNMLAFALPMLLGLAADVIGKNAAVSGIGCFIILVNYLIIQSPWTSVVLAGIGNGLFHIGGGRQVIQDAQKKYAPSGIFICSGALGVFLGKKMAGDFRQIFMVLMLIALALCVLVLAFLTVKQWRNSIRSHLKLQKLGTKMMLLSLLIFVVVIIRSYYGCISGYSWNNSFDIGLIFTLCIVAGKFLGGIAADKLGVMTASIISMAGAGILTLFAANSPVVGCLSILLFNMTMPITLALLADVWNELPGFAFGALMMALFLGTLPTTLLKVSWMAAPLGMCGLCAISLVLLVGSILLVKKKAV